MFICVWQVYNCVVTLLGLFARNWDVPEAGDTMMTYQCWVNENVIAVSHRRSDTALPQDRTPYRSNDFNINICVWMTLLGFVTRKWNGLLNQQPFDRQSDVKPTLHSFDELPICHSPLSSHATNPQQIECCIENPRVCSKQVHSKPTTNSYVSYTRSQSNLKKAASSP